MSHRPAKNRGEDLPSADDLLLQRYVDGELRAAERQEFELLLARSPALAERCEELRALRGVLTADHPPLPLGVGFADRTWAEFRRHELVAAPPQAARQLELLRGWSLVAASLVVLLGAALLFWRPGAPTGMTAADLRPGERQKVLDELDRKADAAERERAQARKREQAEREDGKTSHDK